MALPRRTTMEAQDTLQNTKARLDRVSPSFCLAKWLQVTIHLQSGLTHSCHHPRAHKIPMDEIRQSPGALHNTSFKKLQRKMMLEGEKPTECDYCWRIEGVSDKQISDRHIKSNDEWALPQLDKVANTPWNQDYNPSYVEVSFSNKCNFKCAYCQPMVSSKWMAEIVEHGPYPTHHRFNSLEYLQNPNSMPIEDEDLNPYVKAFWDWWPSLRENLEVFRITGGEPLLSKSTFRIMDELAEQPLPKLDFIINTNLGAPEQLVNSMVAKARILQQKNAVKSFSLYTSLDTWGKDAEYLRFGLNLAQFERNMELVLTQIPNLNLTVMCTFNLLSTPRFRELLDKILFWKARATDLKNGNRVILDVSYLRHPEFLSVGLMPAELVTEMERNLSFMKANHIDHLGYPRGFLDFEILKVERMIEYVKKDSYKDYPKQHYLADLGAFIREYDRRRHTQHLEVFPTLHTLFTAAAQALALRH